MGIFDAGIGGLYKGFKSFMHPEKGYQKAQNALDKYYGESQGYLNPYNQQGQQAYGNLNTAMQKLLNPTALYDEWSSAYAPSEHARLTKERAMNDALRVASSQGLLGSTASQQAIQGGLHDIEAQDFENFMNRMIQQYLQGAQIAQGIYGTGSQAGHALAGNAANMGSNAAEMAFGRQNAPGQLFGSLLGTGANLAGAYMGNNAMGNMASSWKSKV